MKTHYCEMKKRIAKQNFRANKVPNWMSSLSPCNIQFGETTAERSWYENVVTSINNYPLLIQWSHPRKIFFQRLQQMTTVEIFTKEIYWNKRQGREAESIELHRQWFHLIPPGENRGEVTETILDSDHLRVVPSFHSTWEPFGRIVTVCLPLEVRNLLELEQLIQTVKSIATHSTSLAKQFPAYSYSAHDWRTDRDFLRSERHAPIALL